MTDDMDAAIDAIADRTQRDLWGFVVHAPPDPMVMRDLCALSAQLCFTEIFTGRHGCSVQHAKSFVVEADRLSVGVERLGACVANSALAAASREADAFAIVMLDMIVASDA
jgi:hypothetical protein